MTEKTLAKQMIEDRKNGGDLAYYIVIQSLFIFPQDNEGPIEIMAAKIVSERFLADFLRLCSITPNEDLILALTKQIHDYHRVEPRETAFTKERVNFIFMECCYEQLILSQTL